VVRSQDPFLTGSFPSRMTLASVMLRAEDPDRTFFAAPSRFSTTSSEERRSPWLTPKPPGEKSKRATVSGLNALVSPNKRYGLWISTPSMTVRFSSGDPPRTEIRLPSSSVATTPGRVWMTWKMLSSPPATVRTRSGVTGSAPGSAGGAGVAFTSTRSKKRALGTRAMSRGGSGSSATVTRRVSSR